MSAMDLQKFEDYLTRRMRDTTARDYIQRFNYVYSSVSPFTPENINAWFLAKKREGVQGNSINNLVKAVRAYATAYELEWKIPYFAEEPTEKEIFTDTEIESFLNLPKLPYFHYDIWEQWTMFFSILAFSGMRGNEVASLTVEQIDFIGNHFVLPKTKTRPRKVPIAVNLIEPLKKYVVDKDKYLFPTDRGSRGHVWRAGWQKHFNIRKKALGFTKKKLTTHSFRHSHATNLYENGVELPDIMKIEGHKNYDTALKYIHLSDKSSQKAINKHSIVQKSLDATTLFNTFLEEAKKQGILDDSKFHFVIEPDFFAIWKKGSKKKKLAFTDT